MPRQQSRNPSGAIMHTPSVSASSTLWIEGLEHSKSSVCADSSWRRRRSKPGTLRSCCHNICLVRAVNCILDNDDDDDDDAVPPAAAAAACNPAHSFGSEHPNQFFPYHHHRKIISGPQKPWKEECKYGPSKQSFQNCSTALLPRKLRPIFQFCCKSMRRFLKFFGNSPCMPSTATSCNAADSNASMDRCFFLFPSRIKGRARSPFRQLPPSPPRAGLLCPVNCCLCLRRQKKRILLRLNSL